MADEPRQGGAPPPPASAKARAGSSYDDSTRELDVPSRVPDDAGDSLYLREPIASHELSIGARVGRYSVIGRIGEGGMGVVYKAQDPQLDRLVALKVLRTGRAHERDPKGLGLLAEAQTLAKIEHPNIVTVYDAGVTEDRVFITMELCRGQNLREWLAQGQHAVRDVLAVFVAAGRGLAAAHAAGVVHRDFKPANVLLGEGGTVQVADFGMARMVELAIDTNLDDTLSASEHDRSVSTIVGTPTYMAPEQLMGRLGDHRMDQFSFCLCLYGALVGEAPFSGRTFQERRRVVPLGLGAVERERLNRARHLPVRVRRALLRGLAVEPEDRFPSMNALLAELDVRRRRWSVALSSLTLALGLGIGAFLMSETRVEPCTSVPESMAETWGVEPDRVLAKAIIGTDHPAAAEQLQHVAGAFDRYAKEWKDAYTSACEATYVTRVQSDAIFDLRMRCLERRRAQLEIAVQTMVDADDAAELDARMQVPFRLPAIADCANVEALESAVPLPTDPDTRAQLDALLGRVDEANTLREAGELKEGLSIAYAAVAEARRLGYLPVLAQALECLGRLQADGESPKAAEQTLREAISVGTQGHDDQLVGRAWPSLVFVLVMQNQLVAAEALGFAAEVSVDHSNDEMARAWLFNNLGILYSELEDHPRAADYMQKALGIKTRLYGADDLEVGITWSNLGFVLGSADRWSEAADAFDQAQVILAETVGVNHRLSDIARTGLCRGAVNAKNYELALQLCTEALHRLESLPTSPASMCQIQRHTATALLGLGRKEQALAMARSARALVEGIDPGEVSSIDEWITKVLEEMDEVVPEP